MTKPNIYASPQVEPMLGYPASAWESDPDLLAKIVHPDDRERVLGEAKRVRSTGEPLHDEYRYLTPDGRVVWVEDETYLVNDEQGRPAFVQGYLLDITERKQTEAERDRLREELHHAQKLEAIGRLAGGVAHDFNNMLTAIKGYSELLLGSLDRDDPLRAHAAQIRRAAEQAASLPRQLLAFSRKQTLQPELVDLSEVVANTSDLLRRRGPRVAGVGPRRASGGDWTTVTHAHTIRGLRDASHPARGGAVYVQHLDRSRVGRRPEIAFCTACEVR